MSIKATATSRDSGQNGGRLDETNLRILAELRENGRISMAALAEKVNISRANVYTRVEGLIADGVITGFTALVDPAKSGLGICALVFVTVHPQEWEPFRRKIEVMPDIESCRITTGEHDAMLVIRAPEVGAIHDFVIGVIAALTEVKSVETVLVLDEVFERPFLLPSDLPVRENQNTQLGLTRFTRTGAVRAGADS
ncbi:MAG: Lrp/AsnC family transcriptional regulator [Homoserinimonas sp.]